MASTNESAWIPADLFARPEHLSSADEPWWVIHTRPRVEKALARQLLRYKTTYFLPLYERRYRVQRRWECSRLPLFPGYLFLRGDESQRVQALRTNFVANSLRVEDQERLVSDLVRVYQMIQSGAAIAPEERLQPGMTARITSGPLAGQEGVVVRRGGSLRFVIEVNFLQRGASVEVDSSMIRPA